MAIFDIDKNDLHQLSDVQLEELIARLAEAEVAAYGHSPAHVVWSGSINAPDGGVDIHVQVPAETLNTGFLERPDTILQAKKHSMPKSAIDKEMVAEGKLSSTISGQAVKGGSYIIVSLGDDCSPLMKKDRIEAMRDAVKDDPNSDNIHLDFYDRSKLTQWLRQHPSVMLWVKRRLGQGYSGWQPYGAWSNPPQGAVDTLISAPGVTVSLPLEQCQKLSIEEAIDPMRALIKSTNKAVRITGLSGVGKTRIVQALFDEAVGTDALDRTIAVYVDTGADPYPSAAAMLDTLIAEGRPAIMILDNCPSELHFTLASKVSAAGGEVSLITVEYDIRDDKPQTTEVIHIETVGTEVAEQLLMRRFPSIGWSNARQIARFSNGNARVSLAIAERVGEGESLAQLSDAQLFDRLFEQRNSSNDDLREQAEILSLVYSFSVSSPEGGDNELEILGSLSGHSRNQLFRSAQELLSRHVVQKRAHWRAILPHAVANRLAASALNSFPVDQLRETFEAPGRQRLLMSFAHRLGLLHNHPVAKEIVEAWLQPDGLLGQILALDSVTIRMLDYIAPVAPEALLDRIEALITAPDFEGIKPRHNSHRSTIINLLQSLAYEQSAFDRSVRLLIRMLDYEDEGNNLDTVRNKVTGFFQAYLSGTHASLNQRVAIMNECLSSGVAGRRSLGFRMLSMSLSGPPWSGFGMSDFGARPRDFGFYPNRDEFVEWCNTFIDVAVRLGISGDPDFEGPARLSLAKEFPGLWRQAEARDKLVEAARKLHAHHPWSEGWLAIRTTIFSDYTRQSDELDHKPLPDSLAELKREMEPQDLVSSIMTYVLNKGPDAWVLGESLDCDNPEEFSGSEQRLEDAAFRLGEEFSALNHSLSELGANLFSQDRMMPYRTTFAFGRGLAKGAYDQSDSWQQLVNQLEHQSELNKSLEVFGGFIEEVDAIDKALAHDLLDQCAQHPELQKALVALHPRREFTETDLDRCMAILDDPETDPRMYGPLLWRDQYANLPEGRILDLAQRLLSKPNGDEVVLEALSMRMRRKEDAIDILGADLRQVGLNAAIQRLQRNHHDIGGYIDYKVDRVVAAALRFDGNEAEKGKWLDTIFAVIDKRHGYMHAFESAIETTAVLMPEEFLNRVFEGTNEVSRQYFICNGYLHQPPIANIDINVLVEWCRARSDISVWASVAVGAGLWSQDDDQSALTMSESAIRLLEASPDPGAVLNQWAADHIEPSSWSGSRASAMERRADAIGRLAGHEDPEIAIAAKKVYQKLVQLVEDTKMCERQDDEAKEQRFE